jgi:RNA polymerase sigma factor for flagellar operon FliA
MKNGMPRHVDREDLVAAGMVGLLDALRRFDPNSGTTFSSYAWRRIHGSIRDYLREQEGGKRRDRARREAAGGWFVVSLDEPIAPGRTRREMLLDPGPGPDEQAAKAEVRSLLLLELNRLPASERRVMLLRYFRDLTFGEIAVLIGRTQGRAHQLHSKAIARLRVRLSAYRAELTPAAAS